jgi:hypothetical protein
MTRVFLTIVLPLLLPTALYVLWALITGNIGLTGSASAWRRLPWTWLVVAGTALAAVVVAVLVETGGDREGSYIAPHLEDGRVVPGHVVPAPASR